MPLPPEIDAIVRKRFEELLAEAEEIESVDTGGYALDPAEARKFHALRTSFLSLLAMLSVHDNHSLTKTADEVRSFGKNNVARRETAMILGMIMGLKRDYEDGLLNNLAKMIEANIAGDYLGQADQLLSEGQSGKFDHVPAAVLTGAVLEDGLRRLCQRQNPPIPTEKPNGEPKTLNPLIDDLKKASVFNELKAKQLRAWADIRNSAAHGEFGDFKREDVEQMIKGVQNFLADYL